MTRISFRSAALFVTGLLIIAVPSFAQGVRSYDGELVVAADGRLLTPWKEAKSCAKDGPSCRLLVINPNTKEIARVDGKWSSKFEATGNGREVRRAETAMAKAIRLKGEQVKP